MNGPICTMRPDGRSSAGTLRPLSCELAPLSRSDGSALWKAGSTQVLAAVYGPMAPRKTSLERGSAIISIIYADHREHEDLLEKVLAGCVCADQYKRCVIEVVLQAIHDDGSVLSCALHAAVAALMDAGICMRQLPVATSVVIGEDHKLLLDPDQEEERLLKSCLTLVSSNSNPDTLLGSIGGGKDLSLEIVLACQDAASKAAPVVFSFLRMAVEQKITRQSNTLLSSNYYGKSSLL
mmetsp:Transcript_16840/g.25468  ORF Transcript_16840/g.25468 Transcript_16840/m.25468 type:complete len:237 (-) Transcript_16840:380-1090(-)